jgi:hypothetical protein
LRFFELMGREALISAFSFCFPFAFADNLFDPLTSACQRNWAAGWQQLLLAAVVQQG